MYLACMAYHSNAFQKRTEELLSPQALSAAHAARCCTCCCSCPSILPHVMPPSIPSMTSPMLVKTLIKPFTSQACHTLHTWSMPPGAPLAASWPPPMTVVLCPLAPGVLASMPRSVLVCHSTAGPHSVRFRAGHWSMVLVY
jgi:hypothetical protein